ncbi:DUF1902 domain-containing protein [Oscillatoria salina IIICB1]|nr:DUF1902 domain-containing protein [Oscillatoria salina IIICB1]NET89670.1 DUF1902 domain-containing protein [Kamptonema sp. SIO1D9]
MGFAEELSKAETIESLTTKLRQMIPELMLLNNIVPANYQGFLPKRVDGLDFQRSRRREWDE